MRKIAAININWLDDDELAALAAALERNMGRIDTKAKELEAIELAFDTVWQAGIHRMTVEEFSRLRDTKIA